jgi:hypothetical protein
MAQVTLCLPDGHNRVDAPLHLDRSVVDEVEFDADQCDFAEALGDAGYPHLVSANWLHYAANEWRVYRDGHVVYVAEVVQ